MRISGSPSAFPLRILLAAAALACLLAEFYAGSIATASPQIHVGVLRDFPPHYSVDPEGRPTGFAIDLFEEIAKEAGIEFAYRSFDTWPEAFGALKRGEVQVIPNVGITDTRRAFASFTVPIEVFSISLFVRSDSSFQSDRDLSGRSIGVVSENAAIPLLKQRSEYRLHEFPHFAEALQALMAGRVDGVAYPRPVVQSSAIEFGIEDRLRELSPPLKEIRRGIAVGRGNSALFQQLNDAAGGLVSSDRYGEIYAKWFGRPGSFWTTGRVFWVFAVGAVLSALVSFLGRYRRTASLLKQVTEETEQRKSAELELVQLNRGLEERIDARTRELQGQTDRLERSQKRLQALFDNLSAAVMVHSPDTTLLYMNKLAASFWPLPQASMTGRNAEDACWNFIGEDLKPLPAKDHPASQVIRTGSAVEDMVAAIAQDIDGTTDIKWLLVQGTPLKNLTGELIEILVSFVDITQIKEAEKQLQRAATVFASTNEGVTITDANAVIVDVNDAFTRVTGYGREEAIGENPRILNSGQHDESFYRAMWESLKRNGSWRGEIWNRRKDGSIYPERLSISAIKSTLGDPEGYVAVFSDITQSKETEQKLEFLAHHDALTRLPNRLLLNARLESAIKGCQRNETGLAVIFVDIDRFKGINDSLGHIAGDILLQSIAVRLTTMFRDEDTVARISGDEFVILIEEVEDRTAAEIVAQKVNTAFSEPFLIGENEIRVTASCGVSVYPGDATDVQTLLSSADTAMYRSKQSGRNTITFFGIEGDDRKTKRDLIEVELRSALPQGEFALVYQPKVNIESRKVCGLEALIRWNHRQYGFISPNDFIPVAEEAGLIREIGVWVLSEAARQMKAWVDMDIQFDRVAVNISGSELQVPGFESLVQKILEENSLSPSQLELEVTEHFAIRRDKTTIRRLRALRELGITIAVDDFGTGYSSLAHLRELPVDRLKIDQSFIRDTPQDAGASAIVESVIAMGKILGLSVIAEGVESEEQMDMLARIGCPEAQGYFIGRPADPEQLLLWLEEWRSRSQSA